MRCQLQHADGTSGAAEHVYFSYVPEQKLIENFNLQVKPGQRMAIVGPTGCGKTTVINLLMRFYDVNSGCIPVDRCGYPGNDQTAACVRHTAWCCRKPG